MNFLTRFAPSPTGFLHIGNLRTAIIAWLYALSNQGQVILRIDDTDTIRSKVEFANQIEQDLHKCGFQWKDKFNQSKRNEIYQTYINHLKQKQLIYPCYDTKEELDLARRTAANMNKNFIYDRNRALNLTPEQIAQKTNSPYWRFKLNHEQKITWQDQVKGEICFDPKQISDPVVIREDGTYTYLLISVIDDIDMKISHIIRGEDHISNTATQIQMFEAFTNFTNYNGKIPIFAHLPLLKMPEGKISKRIGGFEIHNLFSQGILPISLINYLMHLGSNLTGAMEAELDIQKLINKFNINSYNNASPNYNFADLEKINIKNLKSLDQHSIKKYFEEFLCTTNNIKFDYNYWETIKHNIEHIEDIIYWFKIYQEEKFLLHKQEYVDFIKQDQNKNILQEAIICLNQNNELIELFNSNDNQKIWQKWIENILNNLSNTDQSISKKQVFLTMRQILTGKTEGPDMNLYIKMIGINHLKKFLQDLL